MFVNVLTVGEPRHVFFQPLHVEGKKKRSSPNVVCEGYDELPDGSLLKVVPRLSRLYIIGRSSVSSREVLGNETERGHYLDSDGYE